MKVLVLWPPLSTIVSSPAFVPMYIVLMFKLYLWNYAAYFGSYGCVGKLRMPQISANIACMYFSWPSSSGVVPIISNFIVALGTIRLNYLLGSIGLSGTYELWNK